MSTVDREMWLDVQPAESDLDWLADALNRRPTKRRNLTIPEYAETTIIPTGIYRGIKYRNDRAPYMVRPMMCLSPQSMIQEVRLMWAAQSAKTTVGELATMYYIQEVPSEILYVSSNAATARKWLDKRITPRVIHAGIEFRSQTDNKASRRSGDTMYSKEFDGGNLDAASALSPASLASETKRIVNADETDRWKTTLGEEGLTWDIMHARTQAWRDQKKILATSTPTISGISIIESLWEEGTQEEYLVPCPHCGHEQELYLDTGNGKGLHWKNTDRGVDWHSVVYLCEKCGKAISENKKHAMLNDGRWEKRAIPKNEYIVSFHINAIYSPFKQWGEIAEQYNDTIGNAAKKQTFTNLVLGLPYIETGARPKVENVLELRGGYTRGTVPDDVVWMTAGIDVQRGSAEDSNNPPRLEMEILGHGPGYRTWSVDYKVFRGSTEDPNDGAWASLREYFAETGLVFTKRDGRKVPVSTVFIDSGDGERMDAVYHFCEPYPAVYPSKGFSALKRQKAKGEKADERTAGDFKRYRYVKLSDSNMLYEISTNYYKGQVYSNLKIRRRDEYPQRAGFCEFPRDYPQRYFEMLTAEEKRADGSFYAGRRRNEALDCFDAETEVLTSQGWKAFHNLNGRESLATVNLETDRIEYQKPLAYIENDHDGEMVHLKGRRMDILVTPGHRMVTYKKIQERQADGSRKWNLNPPPAITLAKDLTIHHQIKVAAGWAGRHSVKEIPAHISKQGIMIDGAKTVDGVFWAQFLGIYVSEGCKAVVCGKKGMGYRIQIDQNPGWKADRIRDMLSRLPFRFREEVSQGTSCRWICNQKQLYLALHDCGEDVYTKKAPPWIKGATQDCISAFLEFAIMGDGWIQTKETQRDHRTYATVSRQLADDMQELFIKNGTAANIREVNPAIVYRDSGINVAKDKLFTAPNRQYHVSECKAPKASLDSSRGGKRHYLGKTANYTGKVYCATVPNGTLVLRRKGKSFIAGNCRVMALCAGEVYLEKLVAGLRDAAKTAGADSIALEQIGYREAISYLVKMAAKTPAKANSA